MLRCFLIGTTSTLLACSEPIIISADGGLPNGAVYEGELESGKFHGKGKLVYPSGAYYSGEFLNGQFNGQGIFSYPSGEHYEGQFANGVYHGEGEYIDAKENHYKGLFSGGRFNGAGTYKKKDGTIYEGEFKNGSYHGKGIYTRGDQVFEGDFVDGVLSGNGRYTGYDGSTYEGEVENWLANGSGIKTDSDGTIITGNFVDGYVEGAGKMTTEDGSEYNGPLEYGRPEGEGVMKYVDGRVYEGEFSFGSRHGEGTLTNPSVDDNPATVVRGKWRGDKLVHDFASGERQHMQAEVALQQHQELLEQSLRGLQRHTDASDDMYFLGVAGDGSQSVFKREIEYVRPLIEQRYASAGNSLVLINHHDTAAQYPMATNLSIASAVKAISQKMDVNNDVLFVYLTSHGSQEHEFYLNHDSIKLPPVSAPDLAAVFKDAGIKWKVVVISACYAGGFLPSLRNDTSLVITAADAQSRSFGCSEEAEMTYFGRAFFKEAMANNPEKSLPALFKLAQHHVTEWETEQKKKTSNPMIHAPTAIVQKLARMRINAGILKPGKN